MPLTALATVCLGFWLLYNHQLDGKPLIGTKPNKEWRTLIITSPIKDNEDNSAATSPIPLISKAGWLNWWFFAP